MAGVFISYRRQDSAGWAGRLATDLLDRFGTGAVFQDIDAIGAGEDSVIRGYQNYYAVPGNMDLMKSFYDLTTRAWLRTLRRRSHKGQNYTWKRFEKLIRWLIPRVRIVHPFPDQRFQRYYPR